jgi:hypothetical protein
MQLIAPQISRQVKRNECVDASNILVLSRQSGLHSALDDFFDSLRFISDCLQIMSNEIDEYTVGKTPSFTQRIVYDVNALIVSLLPVCA